MDTIFIDTNSIRNKKTSSFFGNIDKYQKLSDQVQIIIPSIVVEEIKRQKKRYLNSQLNKFQENYFTKYLDIDSGEVLVQHIDEKVAALYQGANEEISHVELELGHQGKLQRIKELAIGNIPPFEAETDKGFKDSYFYLTVLQYKENSTDDVFVITNDTRLKEAFNNTDIKTLTTAEEYYKYREEYFREEYFIAKLRDHFGNEAITKDCIKSIELTEDEDWQITLDIDGEHNIVIVDFVTKELISER